MSLLISKLSIGLLLCLDHCFVRLRDLVINKIGADNFGEHWNVVYRRMEKIKWSEKVTNEQVLDRIGEKRTLLNNILRRKANWIGHILRRNCFLDDAIEGQMTEVKGVGRRKRRTQPLHDLRNRKRYWELQEEAEDQKRCRRQFINRT